LKKDCVKLECDFCGKCDSFCVTDPVEIIIPIISRWRGVMDGDSPPGQGADSHRWYDALECMISGERNVASQKAEASQKQEELNKTLARANESLKKSGFMEKQVTQ
jgi:hypothetical protein